MTHWSNDVGAADWIVERLHPFASDVGSLVPEGFEAYVRILHPARGAEPPDAGTLDLAGLEALTEILAVHTQRRESCWFAVWDGYGWLQGPPAVAELTSPGAGGTHADLSGVPRDAARVDVPYRPMVLYEGPIEAAAAFCGALTCQSPNLWWPQDRSWCVASEIDLLSTYVGGSQALAERLLREERHEAFPARVTDRIA